MRGNTRRGSRRNIMAHYDLGNDFYALWLDPGDEIFLGDLERRRRAISRRPRRRSSTQSSSWPTLAGGERVLEIGCGWGVLAKRLAEAKGAQVTGLTLSPASSTTPRARAAARRSGRRRRFPPRRTIATSRAGSTGSSRSR